MTVISPSWATGYLATAMALGGCAVGLARWTRLDRGRRIVTVWLGTSALCDIATYIASPLFRNTQPIAQLWFVASVVLGIEALATFQDRRGVVVLRAMSAAYVVAWIILAVAVEPIIRYSTYSVPLQGVVLLGAAVATLLRRVSRARRDLLADPGFLIAIALGAVAIPSAFQTVVAQLWFDGHDDRTDLYYAMANIVAALAAVLLLVAIRLPAGPAESSR